MADCLNGHRMTHALREAQEKRAHERKRNIVCLIRAYLREVGLEQTLEAISKETRLGDGYEVCDNVDLDTILQEFNSYYYSKFNKFPKICKKVDFIPDEKKDSNAKRKEKKPPPQKNLPIKCNNNDDFQIVIKQIGSDISVVTDMESDCRMLSYLPDEASDPEMKEIAERISREVIPKNLGIKWQDCIGLEHVMETLKEAVIYPIKYPQLFCELDSWRAVLLYGPPGNGKTLIAKALACESPNVFVNVTPSTFVSKWRGDSEKYVRVLFEVTRRNAPCGIFIDELDGLASHRDENQHEASRRFKSEFLSEMDGILYRGEEVFLLATTNLPWTIDPAILRRFDKKIFVGPPGKKSRIAIFRKYLGGKAGFGDCDFERFADMTQGFCASDIRLVCKKAFMNSVRREVGKVEGEAGPRKKVAAPCCLTVEDVELALKCTKPLDFKMEKYEEWEKSFGCT